jgi:hypothetical protein
MKLLKMAFVAALFYVLTPGVVLSLPPGSSYQVQAAVHAVVFALVLTLSWKFVKKSM